MSEMNVRGLTVAVHAGDRDEALGFYCALIGREPDLGPDPDFYEWEISPGAWLQLATGRTDIRPSSFRLRLQVEDIEAAVEVLRTKGFEPGDIKWLPGLVAFANLTDPWGNPLGVYQDLGVVAGP
ncbi:VOC family protein [Jatrophihabitans sp.]|jgi:predicted enzyme related to lactoylglutathione lyase|uniref:VOC family protein n=1 Tax=Jatrophihabitans sp. TaxID=1932789 RepID=UPI002EE33EDC